MAERGVTPIPREARPYQGQPAGLVTRVVAAVIDGGVVVLALLLAYAAFAGMVFLLNPREFDFPTTTLLLSLTTASFAAVAYLSVSWWLNGRSYGAHLMGLHVVDRRGRNLRLGLALGRAVFCVTFPVGLLWVAVSRENRSVQDLVLRTSVVYDWQR
jgi:uncharacterized RDD family membrane protein YckC